MLAAESLVLSSGLMLSTPGWVCEILSSPPREKDDSLGLFLITFLPSSSWRKFGTNGSNLVGSFMTEVVGKFAELEGSGCWFSGLTWWVLMIGSWEFVGGIGSPFVGFAVFCCFRMSWTVLWSSTTKCFTPPLLWDFEWETSWGDLALLTFNGKPSEWGNTCLLCLLLSLTSGGRPVFTGIFFIGLWTNNFLGFGGNFTVCLLILFTAGFGLGLETLNLIFVPPEKKLKADWRRIRKGSASSFLWIFDWAIGFLNFGWYRRFDFCLINFLFCWFCWWIILVAVADLTLFRWVRPANYKVGTDK